MSKKPIKPKEPPKQKTITQEYLEERFVGETLNLEDFTKRIVSLGFLPKDISICFETGYDYDSYTQVSIFAVKENIIPDDEYKVIIEKYEEDLKKYKKDLAEFNKQKDMYKFSNLEKECLKDLIFSVELAPSSKQAFIAYAKDKVEKPSVGFSKVLNLLNKDSHDISDINYLLSLKKILEM